MTEREVHTGKPWGGPHGFSLWEIMEADRHDTCF